MNSSGGNGNGRSIDSSQEQVEHISADKYYSLINSINDGFCIMELIVDEQGNITNLVFREQNPLFDQYTGLGNVVGKSLKELLPHFEKYWIDIYTEVARTGKPMKIENYLQDVDRWFDISFTVIGGAPYKYVAVIFVDITGRKRLEQERALLSEISKDLIESDDMEETLEVVRRKTGEHFQVKWCAFIAPDEKYDNYKIRDWHAPDVPAIDGQFHSREFLSAEQKSRINSGEATIVNDILADTGVNSARYANLGIGAFVMVPLVRKTKWIFQLAIVDNKSRRWRADEVELLKEIAGRIWTWMEKAKAEDALRKNEEKYRSLFNSIDEGFCLFELLYDRDGRPVDYRYVEVNPAFQRQTGLTDVIGKTGRELKFDGDFFWINTYDQVYRTGKGVRFENYQVENKRWYNVYASKVESKNGHFIAAIFTDITRRKAVEDELHGNARKLERLLKLRDEFISVASHELKTPVTSMKTYAEIIEESLRNTDDKKNAEMIRRINAQIDRLTLLINHLLDNTKVSEGGMGLNFEELDVVRLLERVIADTGITATHSFVLHAQKLPLVMADHERLAQVLNNLLSNAMKYSAPDSTITVKSELGTNGVVISVRDEGLGIPEADMGKVFDRFFRVTSDNRDTYPGMGLGLYITAQIIWQHGGRIWVDSKEGTGSVFSFELPFKNQQST